MSQGRDPHPPGRSRLRWGGYVPEESAIDSGDRAAVSAVEGTQTRPRLLDVFRRVPGPVVTAGAGAVVFAVVVLAAAIARPLGALLVAVVCSPSRGGSRLCFSLSR